MISVKIFSAFSLTTTFFPVSKVTTVSGVSSRNSIRCGLSQNSFPFNLVTWIIWSSPVSEPAAGRRLLVFYGGGWRTPSAALNYLLPFQIHQFLQHLVGGSNDPGIGLKTTLGNDHVREFLRKIHIGHFQMPRG